MQFLGRIIGTVSNVFVNPYRVREVQLSEYGSKVKMKQEGWTVLYRDTSSQAWDCVLIMPNNPVMALRSVVDHFLTLGLTFRIFCFCFLAKDHHKVAVLIVSAFYKNQP